MAEEQLRVGTFNVRVITSDDTGENAWEKRKSRVVNAINECDFDVFGLNECSTATQSYLSAQLKNSYNIQFFSPYAQNGTGNKAQGLAYRKGWSLSDWHYFWLSDTPDVMTTNDGAMNRGGCCGILSKDGTDLKVFVMVTHGALSAETRSQYAELYEQMEKKYNPGGYPSFFVGDMNSKPSGAASVVYRRYWSDAYYAVGEAGRSGPAATYNGWDLELDLYSSDSRIDYIYYRGATPLSYVCSDTRYGGCYPSDHLPVYADFRIE